MSDDQHHRKHLRNIRRAGQEQSRKIHDRFDLLDAQDEIEELTQKLNAEQKKSQAAKKVIADLIVDNMASTETVRRLVHEWLDGDKDHHEKEAIQFHDALLLECQSQENTVNHHRLAAKTLIQSRMAKDSASSSTTTKEEPETFLNVHEAQFHIEDLERFITNAQRTNQVAETLVTHLAMELETFKTTFRHVAAQRWTEDQELDKAVNQALTFKKSIFNDMQTPAAYFHADKIAEALINSQLTKATQRPKRKPGISS